MFTGVRLAGDYFGEIALLTDSVRQATCVAVGKAREKVVGFFFVLMVSKGQMRVHAARGLCARDGSAAEQGQ